MDSEIQFAQDEEVSSPLRDEPTTESFDNENIPPARISPDDDFQREELPEKPDQRVIAVSSVPNLHSVLADATREEEKRKSTPDLSFVAMVRQVSVESLMELARPFFDSRQSTALENPDAVTTSTSFGPVVENYYDMFEQKFDDATINSLTKPELEAAIDALKDQILALPSEKHHSERASMVQKLILLRLKIQEIEDFNPKSAGITSMGHHFTHSPIFRHMSKRGRHCEVCGQLMIFAPSQFDCTACGFSCHERCISSIARNCVAEQVLMKPAYILEICPEKGLDTQNFACAECRKAFPMDKPEVWEAQTIRLCDYNGKYYCTVCHRNDLAVSPGRAVKNWDFTPRLVCRQSKQILQMLASHPILNLQEVNKDLSAQVEGIARVQDLRARLAVLHRMMLDCEEAPQIALLHKLPSSRKHFLTKSSAFSLNDLIDIDKELLVKELTDFSDALEGHVRVTCPSCFLLSTYCATCKKEGDKLYAFEGRVAACATCGANLHKACSVTDPLCTDCRKKARAV
ncbi:Differentially expressed in FDCP 8-like protein [Hypsibius exemplaris]|uniref:Differentially expressed in FDCP 8-like protein n=1 Tax=Hypsibius exemplaris TaxID=2072580 RepID=A0A1W0X291_HYPEX|nr:Differentially expressed in FDCP 8-like protein [Hypsibius exemplaris]